YPSSILRALPCSHRASPCVTRPITKSRWDWPPWAARYRLTRWNSSSDTEKAMVRPPLS
ncbi:hypothetical protein PBMFNG_PBMFNG_12745, partial [Dysosmobacter welbionis]